MTNAKKTVKDYSVDRIFPADREGLPTEGRKPKFSDVARHQKQNKATNNNNISANNL